MASRREQILGALSSRLAAIAIGNGYNTDAGAEIWLGQVMEFGEDDPNAVISIVVGDEQPTGALQKYKVQVGVPYEIQAVVRVSPDRNEWRLVERMIEDIKRAVELDDPSLGLHTDGRMLVNGNGSDGLIRDRVRTLPREPGMTTVGAGVTYIAQIVEQWGAP
jgi:hypothetical protein